MKTYQDIDFSNLKNLLATYFSFLEDIIYPSSASLLIDGLHIDCCRAPEQFNSLLPRFQKEKVLSLGIVYGRNIWHNDLHRSLTFLEKAQISIRLTDYV